MCHDGDRDVNILRMCHACKFVVLYMGMCRRMASAWRVCASARASCRAWEWDDWHLFQKVEKGESFERVGNGEFVGKGESFEKVWKGESYLRK